MSIEEKVLLIVYGVGTVVWFVITFWKWVDEKYGMFPVNKIEVQGYARLVLLSPVWVLVVTGFLGKVVFTLFRDAFRK